MTIRGSAERAVFLSGAPRPYALGYDIVDINDPVIRRSDWHQHRVHARTTCCPGRDEMGPPHAVHGNLGGIGTSDFQPGHALFATESVIADSTHESMSWLDIQEARARNPPSPECGDAQRDSRALDISEYDCVLDRRLTRRAGHHRLITIARESPCSRCRHSQLTASSRSDARQDRKLR
jgi:hypothetical protein